MITKIAQFLAANETIRDVAFGVFIISAVYFYYRAVSSRKHYKCPHCGNSFRVENMQATHCTACGAEVTPTQE